MSINPYFKSAFNVGGDQKLLQALTNESIQIKGRDFLYIPREFTAFDRLYGEDKLSAFSKYWTIEMYIENFNSFGGQHELVSHFGFEVRDEIVLVASKSRFEEIVQNELIRPREGDLIFFPYDRSLFEITFVDNEEIFYQLGKIFTYQIFCKRFEYAAEKFNTGVPEIDNVPVEFGNSTELVLGMGTGTYQPGEIVYQGADVGSASFMASVVSEANGKLIVTNIRGEPALGIATVGFVSQATWTLVANDVGEHDQTSTETNAGNLNTVLDDQSVGVVDRSVNNPQSYGY